MMYKLKIRMNVAITDKIAKIVTPNGRLFSSIFTHPSYIDIKIE